MKYQLLPVLLVAVSARAGAPVNGRVLNENGAPVAGARVTFDCGGTKTQASTDASGLFTIAGTPGRCLARVERQGYFELKDRPIELGPDANEITLVLNPVRELFESLEVNAAAPPIDFESAASEKTVTGTELLLAPYPNTNNLKSALRMMPGIVQDTRGAIHLNGSAEEQVLYTLNGFNITDPLTGRFESRISVESVQQMDLLSGQYSAEFGKGSAGVLAVHTDTGDDKLRFAATNFVPGIENQKGWAIGNWTPRLTVSGPLQRGRAWFSNTVSAIYDKTVVKELPPGQDTVSSWRLADLLHAQVNLAPSNILRAGLLVNSWTAQRTGLSALDPMETTVDRRSHQWFAHVKDQVFFGRGAIVEFGVAANRTFGREIPQGSEFLLLTPDGKRGNFFSNARRHAGRDQAIANLFLPPIHAAGSHQIKAGIDLDRVNYWQDVRRTGFENFRPDFTPARRVLFAGNGQVSRTNFETSSYVQDSWRARPSLLIETGLRSDWDRILRNWNWSPRAGFAWSPKWFENTKVSGGYAITYDATNLRMITRPFDQYLLTTYFTPSGDPLPVPPGASVFTNDSRRLRSPRYQNWNAGVEHRLPFGLFSRVSYLRKRGSAGLTYANTLVPNQPPPPDKVAEYQTTQFDAIYNLCNSRRDSYDGIEFAIRQNLRKQYEWMASYSRSRAKSNSVVDVSTDEPMVVPNNTGPLTWDTPHRLVSWGYLPTFWKDWAIAYLSEWRSGFPFSIQDAAGRVEGNVNSRRFPAYFDMNLHFEKRFVFRGHRWAFRFGFNNLTGHENPTVVNNEIGAPTFLQFYGSQGRTTNFRIRWLGKM